MLDPADAIVVERDSRLPELRTLLDSDAFAEKLRRICPDREIVSARARYLRYKPQTSCLVAYEVTLGSGEGVRVYARCHADDGPSKVRNVRQLIDAPGPLGPGVSVDPDTATAVFVYPNDYEVRGLRKVHEPERAILRLRRIVPAHPHLFRSAPEVIRYKPERRFVGKLTGEGGPPVALRLYTDPLFEGAREKAWAFRNRDDLRVPRVVGDSARYSALALEWIEGTVLAEVLAASPDPEAEAARTGAALAALHQQRPRLGTMYSAADFGRMVRSACTAVEAIAPDLGKRALDCCADVQEIIQGRRWLSRAIHGDFTPDQALVAGGHVTILDFDRAGYGDPGVDLGSFAAGLSAMALDGRLSAPVAARCGASLFEAYRRVAGNGDGADYRVFTAGALLMMAPEPFRQRRAGWREVVVGMLDYAERALLRDPVDA